MKGQRRIESGAMNERHVEAVQTYCRFRYGNFWALLSDGERRTIGRAIVGGMPKLTRALVTGRAPGAEWSAADDFVGAIVSRRCVQAEA